MSEFERQVGGSHYKLMGDYQPVEVLRRWLSPEEFRGYMKGTAIVYLARERQKGADQDIKKGHHTLGMLVEILAKETDPESSPEEPAKKGKAIDCSTGINYQREYFVRRYPDGTVFASNLAFVPSTADGVTDGTCLAANAVEAEAWGRKHLSPPPASDHYYVRRYPDGGAVASLEPFPAPLSGVSEGQCDAASKEDAEVWGRKHLPLPARL